MEGTMGRRTVLLIAALVVAALGTTMVFLYVNGVDDRALAKQQPVRVLVAKKMIPAGTSVEDANKNASFERKTISQDSVVPGAVSATTGMAGQVAKTTIYPGEQILTEKFGAAGSTSTLPIPKDRFTISVPINDPALVAGFVTPGMKVALFLNTTANGGQSQVRLLMPDVVVLAIGSRTAVPADAATGAGQPASEAPSTVLTFAVDQNGYQKILFASKHGELYLALPGEDANPSTTEGATTQQNLFN
jgi:pilus assembly protein CpaB